MLNIAINRIGDTLVASLMGRFDSLGAGIFDEEILPLASVNNALLLDFSQVKFLSSAGLRSLLTSERAMKENGGGITLCGVDASCMKILEISGFASQFPVYVTLDEAMDALCRTCGKEELFDKEGRSYRLVRDASSESWFDVWNEESMGQPEKITLNELKFAMGLGSLANSQQQANLNLGFFLAAPGLFSVKQVGLPADYILTNDPEHTDVWVDGAIEASGSPAFFVETSPDFHGNIEAIFNDIGQMEPDAQEGIACAGVFTIDQNALPELSLAAREKVLQAGGVFFIDIKAKNAPLATRFDAENGLQASQIYGILLREVTTNGSEEVSSCLRRNLTLDNIVDMIALPRSMPVNKASIWVFIPKKTRNADEKRLQIVYESEEEQQQRNEVIIRRIYRGCSRVSLKRLTGGFTSKTYRVEGYDRQGRKLLPSVLKMGSPEVTRSEVVGCTKFVKPFIHNNSTTIMGEHYEEDWAGLRYNFLGINGPESQLRMFTDIYRHDDIVRSLKILHRVFTKILKPWYGQPRWEEIQPYRDHDPRRMFTAIFEEAEKQFGISADEKEIFIPELQKKLVNPYWYLKNRYDHAKTIQWYTCPIHGDLNMQNILLDEKENIYVIDFSETRIRNAVADFARLEPIVKTEFTHLESQEDLERLVRLEYKLQKQQRMGDPLPYCNDDEDPGLKKAWEVIYSLRNYAKQVTIFEEDMMPYRLAVLEWTFPIVCYVNVGSYAKRFSMISAAIICQQLMESNTE